MERLLLEYAVRITLIAAVVALVLYTLRIKAASARHAVWAGVVLVMLLLPVFLAWGPKAPLRLLPREPRRTVQLPVIVVDGRILASAPTSPAKPVPKSDVSWNWTAFLAGVYFLGLGVLLIRLAIGTWRVRRLLCGSVLRDGRLTHASCVTPITVGWIRPAVVLPVSWAEWPQARLDAILAHECEHARRRDPLFQWIALLNRAIFWFHPLAWWLERHLSRLAEEACDTAVVAQGHDPREYSETLLDLARSVELAGSRIDALGMAMPGAYLPSRIRRMLSGPPTPQVSSLRMACVAAVCAFAVAVFAAGTAVRAQSTGSQTQTGPKFEVASIRPSPPSLSFSQLAPPPPPPPNAQSKAGGGVVSSQFAHGRFGYSSTVFGLIVKAYGLGPCGKLGEKTDCPLISGGPDWIRKDRFDISATTPTGTPDYTPIEFFENHALQLQPLLRGLLADRFNLKIHGEQKPVLAYVMTIGKNGPKLRKAGGTIPDARNVDPNRWRMSFPNMSIQDWTDNLSTLPTLLDRPMLNRTGIEGRFDITVDFEKGPDGELDLGALFQAIEQQLGLKIESNKTPVEVLVVDSVDRPSEN
jgi:bla regulator protein BlaR1